MPEYLEAQNKTEPKSRRLEESTVNDCVVSEQREYLLGKKKVIDVANGSVESLAHDECY